MEVNLDKFQFNSKNIKKLFDENKRNILTAYHYTSPNSFHAIINDGFIRFSDIRYMNDKSETVYAVKIILDYLDEHPGEYLFVREVLDVLIGKNNYPEIQTLRTTNITFNEIHNFQYNQTRSFLFCLSTEKDSLNMWNYYVQNGRYEGFNIGFSLYDLIKTFDTMSEKEMNSFIVYYGKVIYKKDDHFEAVKKILETIESIKYKAMEPKIQFAAILLRNEIESKGLFIKHPEFSSEKEYRIVVRIAENRIPHSKEEAQKYFGENNKMIIEDFCVKNGLIVPFLKVKVPSTSISMVTISPISEFDLASKSTMEFLSVKGFDKAKVVSSKLPIRF